MTGVLITELRVFGVSWVIPRSCSPGPDQSSEAPSLPSSSLSIRAPPYWDVKNRYGPLRTGVATTMPIWERCSISQNTLPVAGSSELNPVGWKMMSCRTPPTSKMIGWLYPGSVSDESERQISSPVRLSSAITLASGSPPTRQISRSPSTSGAPVMPHDGIDVLKSVVLLPQHTTRAHVERKQIAHRAQHVHAIAVDGRRRSRSDRVDQLQAALFRTS